MTMLLDGLSARDGLCRAECGKFLHCLQFNAVAGSLRKTKHRGGGCLSSGSRAIELNAHAEM